MANIRNEAETKELYSKILTAATALFIQKGFEKTTLMDIAGLSGVTKRVIIYEMNSKEEILGHLVVKFLDGVAEASDSAAKKLTDNKLFIIVANEVLQVYMAEMNEDMRNLYLSAYSMPKTSEAVLMRRANILFEQFSDIFPGFAKKDFYEFEIATMGIMRSYMSVPCNMYFSVETKVEKLIESMLRIYKIDEKTISEVVGFIKKIDFKAVAEKAVETAFNELNIKINK